MAEYEGVTDGAGRRVAVVVSRFNELITERLLEGALGCLRQEGVREDDVDVLRVPGAWELPAAAAAVLRRGGYDAIVALGCVIRGETPHFDYVAGEAARGLQELATTHAVPVAFGVLTTDDRDQALARAGGDRGNKGWEAALTALEMADLYRQLSDAGA
ncbi:MAG TPA: 6,7-dimethyl-8-ribityllumazine synthase [Longimicrobiales bacterium]|nr:6,7-dimethyl-8-ribityllumazine synthase [Longimicrobiales bacterium]